MGEITVLKSKDPHHDSLRVVTERIIPFPFCGKRAAMVAATFVRRDTRFEVLIAPDGFHDVLSVLSPVRRCMKLPGYWRKGMDINYVNEKLDGIGEVDAESIVLYLKRVAVYLDRVAEKP